MFAIWCFFSAVVMTTQASDALASFTRTPEGCVNGHNIQKFSGKTAAQCAQLCLDYGDGCLGFEFYEDYGGPKKTFQAGDCQLNGSADMGSCNGRKFNLDFYTKNVVSTSPFTLIGTLDTLAMWSEEVTLTKTVSCNEFSWLEDCGAEEVAVPTNDDLIKFTTMVAAKYYALTGVDPDLTVEPTPSPTLQPTNAPSQRPTTAPTPAPTHQPTTAPTPAPTTAPTAEPTEPAPAAPAAVDGIALFCSGHANCAIKESDSHLDCWGWNHHQVTSGFPDVQYKQACMGEWFGCGLRKDTSTVECWGGDWHGETVPPATEFTRIRCGGHHACGFKDDGHLECWGANYALQSDVTPDVAYASMSANRNHACGIRADNSHIECWGRNNHGELEVNKQEPYVNVACGYTNTCAIRADNGLVDCWGANNHQQSVPVPNVAYVGLSGAAQFVCGVRADNRHVECWGGNHLTEYGITAGIPDQAYAEMQVGFAGHVCARQESGIVDCWGANTYGQGTGRGDTVYGISP